MILKKVLAIKKELIAIQKKAKEEYC